MKREGEKAGVKGTAALLAGYLVPLAALQAIYLHLQRSRMPSVETIATPGGHGLAYPPAAAAMPDALTLLLTVILVLLLHGVVTVSLAWMRAAGRPVSRVTAPLCAALLVVFFFAFLETSLALIHRSVRNPRNLFVPHPFRIWAFDPLTQYPGYSINSLGLRGPEIPRVKEPGELRVLCLGSSITAGNYGIDEVHHYPFLLGRYLEQKVPGRTIRVVNGGVLAYNLYQEMETLFDVYDEVLPDVVILEVAGVYPLMDSFVRSDPTRTAPALRAVRRLLYSSEIFFALRREIQAHVGVSDNDAPHMEKEVQERFASRTATLYSAYEYQLAIYRFCTARGVKVVFFEPYLDPARSTAPTLWNADIPWERLPPCRGMDDPGGRCPHVTMFIGADVLKYFNVKMDVPFILKIRLRDTWGKVPEIAKYMTDNCHPNRAGARMQARDIGEFLLAHRKELFR